MLDELKIHSVKFEGSFPSEKSCPRTSLPEYAFIGRSNVGKSSLINMLVERKDMAHTSKSPGKTRAINLFCVNKSWYLADLPGYGYAKVSKTERKKWQKMIEDYMMLRPNLVCTFILIDLRHELQAIDSEFIDWMGARHLPFALVFTKADKLKPNQVTANQKQIRKALLQTWEEIPTTFVTSSIKGEGREALLHYIDHLNHSVTE